MLELTYAQDLRNCLIHNGAIVSSKGIESVDPTESELIYQTGDRSIVKFGNEYYWTDNESGDMNSTLGYLGVPAGRNKASAADGVAGGRFEQGKTYKYFYTYKT